MGSALLLVSVGIVMSYSTTATLHLDQFLPPLFLRHLGALLLGSLLALAAIQIPSGLLQRSALPLWFFTVLLLLAVEFAGVEVNGAVRWLAVPGLGFRFQPVELCKITTVLAVASVIAQRDGREELSGRRTLIAGILALPPIGLLLLQPDLGNAILLAILVGLLVVVAGTRLARLVIPGLVGVIGVGLYVSQNAYAWRRITAFIDPWAKPLGEGFQLVQSFVAFGRGGLFGVGLGNGQQKLAYLPFAHTDFILALIAEELGLIGVLSVLAGFAVLLMAGMRIAGRARNRFDLLVAFGMTALLTVPALINASVVMGVLPTKGLTLPFLSYGRSSLVSCCLALGLLIGVAHHSRGGKGASGGSR
jgi:cell division protein FtsW